ncbi:MAG: M20/M25/M40 family metallo-hydrolase [Thermoanaerobaculia bacterium]
MKLSTAELVALHRELVRTPSVSGKEEGAIALAAERLAQFGLRVERVGGSLLAWSGDTGRSGRPFALFDSHLDTVPVCPGWTFAPHAAEIVGDRIHGLGANDAKASAAAMVAAAAAFAGRGDSGLGLCLALVRDEERKSAGTAEIVAELDRRGLAPAAVVVGEPTGLDLAIAQKGHLVLELVARGEAAHAAHARALGAPNAATALARDLVAIAALLDAESGPLDPRLGRATVEPTMLEGGTARNVVSAEARAILDCRTVPVEPPEALRDRLAGVVAGELVVLSDRFRPVATDAGSELVRAAQRARPEAKLYGSATLSDLTFFAAADAVKAGPGESARSHRPDEFVTVGELASGATFYEQLLVELASAVGSDAALLDSPGARA